MTALTRSSTGYALAVGVCVACLVGSWASASEQPLLAFTAAYAVVASFPLWVESEPAPTDVFRPYYCIIILVYLYAAATPLVISQTGLTAYGDFAPARDVNTFYAACLTAALGMSLATLLGAAHARSRVAPILWLSGESQRHSFFVATALVGCITAPWFIHKFNPAAATSYVDEATALRVRRLGDSYSGIRETFLENVPAVLVLCSATLLCFKGQGKGKRLLGGFVLLLFGATSLLSGWRSDLVLVLLLVGIYVHYAVRRIRWREVVVAGAAIYVLVNLISLVRVSADPRVMLGVLTGEVQSNGYQFLALQRSGELTSSTSLLRLITGIRNHESAFGHGRIALDQIAAFLPRFVMHTRPDMASERFVKTFFPGVFEAGGGYGFFVVGDGYWDFGLLGSFFYCGAYAYALERLYRSFRRRFEGDFAIFLYALCYSQLALAVARSGIFASVKGAMIAIMPLLPVYLAELLMRRHQAVRPFHVKGANRQP